MRRYRLGLWLIAGALAASFAMVLRAGVVRLLYEAQAIREPALTYFQIAGYVDLALSVVLFAGGILAAAGTEGPRRRWLVVLSLAFAAGRLAILAPWLLQLLSIHVSEDLYRSLVRAGGLCYLGGEAALAMAALRGGGHRPLARGSLAVTAVLAITVVVVLPATLRPVDAVTGALASVLALFVALDLLGAFPPLEQSATPPAQIPGHTRGIASTIAIAFAAIGVGLAALALWTTKQTSSADTSKIMLARGVALFAASMSAVWRMRGRALGVGWLAAGAVALYVAGLIVLALNIEPVQNVKLTSQRLPGLSISLPEGTAEHAYTYRELGKLTVMTRHADLGLVTLSWTSAEQDPMFELEHLHQSQIQNIPFREIAGEVDIAGTVLKAEHLVQLHASWKCPGDPRWFVLELSRYASGTTVLREVASKIFRTIQCDAATRQDAPALTIDVPKSPYVPGDFLVRWSANDAYLDGQPAALLDLVNYGAYAADVVALPRVHVESPKNVVESSDRSMFEVVVEDKRVLASTWRCFGLDIDVALFHVGPANAPREPIVEAMRGAHCPH